MLLLSPCWRQFRNRSKRRGREGLRAPFIAALTAALWTAVFVIFVKALQYFSSEELFGVIAALKLMSMTLITFSFVLIISNIVTAVSTYFLSEDLELLVTGPVSSKHIYEARFVETLVDSSWMVLIFGFPIFIAYGWVFSAPWTFYALSLVSLTCLLTITTACAVFVVETLVRTFPVRRLRDLFVFVGLLTFAGLYLAFRMMRPEEFMNPEGFASMMDYLSTMGEPSSPLLPSSWILELLRPYISGFGHEHRLYYSALIIASAFLAFRLVGHYHEAVYFSGYSRAQEGRGARLSRSRTTALLNRTFERFFAPATTRLIMKELLLMARDSGRLGQLLLLGALIIVYLYNFSVLPSLDSPTATFFLKNFIAFINIGLAGFVLSSLGVRFIFPAISSEGRAFWILKGAPMTLRKALWIKFCLYLAPMLFLGLFLAIATNTLLKLDAFVFVVSTLTVAGLTVGVTSLSIAMGVFYADFQEVDPNRLFTGVGALLTMVYAGLAVAAAVALEAYPVYRVLVARHFGRPMGPIEIAGVVGCFAGALAVIVLLAVKPMAKALRRIGDLEI
jgi:ABC-2 type transport system permease protein